MSRRTCWQILLCLRKSLNLIASLSLCFIFALMQVTDPPENFPNMSSYTDLGFPPIFFYTLYQGHSFKNTKQTTLSPDGNTPPPTPPDCIYFKMQASYQGPEDLVTCLLPGSADPGTPFSSSVFLFLGPDSVHCSSSSLEYYGGTTLWLVELDVYNWTQGLRGAKFMFHY